VLATEDSTHLGNGNGLSDILDIALIRNLAMEQEMVVLNEGSSDHNPIVLTLWTGARTPDTITCRSTDCEQYRMLLQRDATPIPRLETAAEINDAVRTLVQGIRQALVSSTKITTKPYIP